MKIFSILLLSLALVTTSACLPEKDNVETPITIKVKGSYAFATLPGASTGAAFMVIENIGDADDKLIGVTSQVAEFTEIHQNIIDPDDSTMMMRKVRELNIPAGKKVILEPKGYHVMFIKLKEPLTMSTEIPVTLKFENAGDMKADVMIVSPGTTPDHAKHH